MKKLRYIYNGILFSHRKEILPFVTTWMRLEDMLSLNKSEKEKHYMISLICGI